MLKSHRVAAARIFADIIKADRIIDAAEMGFWHSICEKYGIDRSIRIEAQEISFAEALSRVCGAGESGVKEDLLADCRLMTESDGFCASQEALLMMALTVALDSNASMDAEVYSIPRAAFNIDAATVLYVESGYDSITNDAINASYRTLFKEMQLAGFQFVYIPEIIRHYKMAAPSLLRDILSFISPTMSDDGISVACQSLLTMTTSTFCKDILCNKCGMTELRHTLPSLLIKIGDSYVGEARYANYLKFIVDEDILQTVRRFVDLFMSMRNGDVFVVSTSGERDNQFYFHGFHKQLIDIFLLRSNIRSSVCIDPGREEVCFPEIDSKATGLHRRERALYALLLCQGPDGISFAKPSTVAAKERYDRKMRRLQARYAVIYEMFGGAGDSAPDLGIPEIRRPIFSCLKRALGKLKGLYNPDDYNVVKNKDGVYSVHIERSLVYVRQLDGDCPVPLEESELYKRWAGI